MIDSDLAAQMHMVKEYVGNAKKFYDHLENCEVCRKKMAEIWQHVYQVNKNLINSLNQILMTFVLVRLAKAI